MRVHGTEYDGFRLALSCRATAKVLLQQSVAPTDSSSSGGDVGGEWLPVVRYWCNAIGVTGEGYGYSRCGTG